MTLPEQGFCKCGHSVANHRPTCQYRPVEQGASWHGRGDHHGLRGPKCGCRRFRDEAQTGA